MVLVYYDNYPTPYYRVPKYVYKIDETKELSWGAMLLYGVVLDRASLSRKNGWLDKEGKTYVYLSPKEGAEIMRTSPEAIKAFLEELLQSGLLEIKEQEDRASRIYPKVVLGDY